MPETDLEKLKNTFSDIGIHYVLESTDRFTLVRTAKEDDAKYFQQTGTFQRSLVGDYFFEFNSKGKLIRYS